jgi:outer membrane protein OmpA-like peptidoglycan-associated protein
MNTNRILPLALAAAALLAACSSVPLNNAQLDEARRDYRAAQENPQARDLAAGELRQAGDALARADNAWTRGDDSAQVDHLAYLARQRVAIAQQTGSRKAAELAVTNARASRDQVRLAARTDEADAARRSATAAQSDAQAAQRDALAAQRDTQTAQRQADDASARARQLEAQLKDLNAKKTERGLVVTIGDVLFETDRAQLRADGMRSVDKLVTFLNEYPQRSALVEGFTDSVGSESHNMELSRRRADSVRTALVDKGVGRGRITTQGYGESHPVAGNDSSSGRQMNRRVEIVLSEENSTVVPR